MALDLPNGLFEQSDVRETTTSTTQGKTTSYWTGPGETWQTRNPDTDQVNRANNVTYMEADGITCFMAVHLPHGAVVTKVEVDGSAAGETWELARTADDGYADPMASAAISTPDTSISSATIDNQTYGYLLWTSSLDTGDVLWNAKITYTI